MTKSWLLLILCAITVASVRADDLADFSNDLATDLGPLLALFGESMTKQFLSESTSFWDYFIFAMAPIGILTAVVSAIRVCGHPYLRAFIGRSQEGDGVVEAELCTSTSRDVCELFNRGGITRVFGRPSILELVHVQSAKDARKPGPQEVGSEVADPKETGLFLFRNYLEHNLNDEDLNRTWKRLTPSEPENKNRQAQRKSEFAPSPNLSLNVGIIKRSRWVFVTIAILGFILQAGVLVLAGVSFWVLGWKLNDDDGPEPSNYAPIMFITGTVVMCGGMWGCAAVIGQTTHEISYQRQSQPPQTSLVWLQPGPQVIGDQNFDPFAYIEDKDNFLRVWTSSIKHADKTFELYSAVAVFATVAGYIIQFIGLRGLKAWVSLTQLGVTVVMSILRGFLRMQRLKRDANKLMEMPDMVAGHELDWLAFQIAGQHSQCGQKPPRWHITTGRNETALEPETDSDGSSGTAKRDGTGNYDLLLVRKRLAHLTGNLAFSGMENGEYQMWKDDFVRVRERSSRLSLAVCRAMENLTKNPPEGAVIGENIVLRIGANGPRPGSSDALDQQDQQLSVNLKHTDSSRTLWKADAAQLEAILGLWMWSVIRNFKGDSDFYERPSLAEKVVVKRIVSVDSSSYKGNGQNDLDLWLGRDSIKLTHDTLVLGSNKSHGLIDVWIKPNSSNTWEVSPDDGQPLATLRRFCGWAPVYEVLRSLPAKSTVTAAAASTNLSSHNLVKSINLQATVASTDYSLLDICTQELFAALITSLFQQIRSRGLITDNDVSTTLSESAGSVMFDNPTVNTLATVFVQCDFGRHSDALLCIIPALGNDLGAIEPEHLLSALITTANSYRRDSQWKRAENLLRWACHRYYCYGSSGEGVASGNDMAARAIRATGELYRWSLMLRFDEARKNFGIAGIMWMNANFRPAGEYDVEIIEILDCYQKLAQRIVGDPMQKTDGNQGHRVINALIEALDNGDRPEALYYLSFVNADSFRYEPLGQALIIAAYNNWNEVMNAMLEMKANPNIRDENGRTAIYSCAESGYDAGIKLLVAHGASLDVFDNFAQSPIFLAAANGQVDMVKYFLDSGCVDVNKLDVWGDTPLIRAIEKRYEAVVQLLLERGADIELRNNSGRTALSWATQKGGESIVQLLLEKGADIGSKDNNGRALLSWAIAGGDEAVIHLLLEKGADRESRDNNGRTPLSWAAQEGRKTVIELLLEKGADIESKDNDGRTILSWAVTRKKGEDIVQLLLEKGADMESKDSNGRTPLSWAARDGDEAVTQLLLEKGADRELKDNNGRTPLSWAATRDWGGDIIQLLLDKGADMESKDGNSWTPLAWAAMDGNEAVIRLLLEKGADRESKDTYGWTPLSLAVAKNREKHVIQLLEKGAHSS